MMMMIDRIDRHSGGQDTISRDEFDRVLRREPPELRDEIIGDLLLGGSYMTAGFIYRKQQPSPAVRESAARQGIDLDAGSAMEAFR
jgi:hypothetical protein